MMAAPAELGDKKRLQFEFGEDQYCVAEELEELLEASTLAETVRRAIGVTFRIVNDIFKNGESAELVKDDVRISINDLLPGYFADSLPGAGGNKRRMQFDFSSRQLSQMEGLKQSLKIDTYSRIVRGVIYFTRFLYEKIKEGYAIDLVKGDASRRIAFLGL